MSLRSLRNNPLTKPLYLLLSRIARIPAVWAFRATMLDRARLRHVVYMRQRSTREQDTARLVMAYHVLEKGLTMPNRRLNFGHRAILDLAQLCEDFLKDHGEAPQVLHAIGALHAYDALHGQPERADDPAFWSAFEAALARLPNVSPAIEPHMTRAAFYADNQAPFDRFARSRHTLRHYAGPLPIERVRAAVRLAFDSAPSACNRQSFRLRCVSDHSLRDAILGLQNGNRGFGHLADKLLIISADLDDTLSVEEHNNVYVEGGILLMNLCYALHFHKIAHCALNWFCTKASDKAIRTLIPSIKETEVVINILACGEAPESFDVAASPRRPLEEVYFEV